jgi:hypothetical protein
MVHPSSATIASLLIVVMYYKRGAVSFSEKPAAQVPQTYRMRPGVNGNVSAALNELCELVRAEESLSIWCQ